MCRLQRRAIHYICQQAEQNVEGLLQESMPTPCASHSIHPCKRLDLLCHTYCFHPVLGFAASLTPMLDFSTRWLVLRDGRALRGQAKPKVILSINRWLAKSTGFQGKAQDSSLEDLGLGDVLPSHRHRQVGKSWDALLWTYCLPRPVQAVLRFHL